VSGPVEVIPVMPVLSILAGSEEGRNRVLKVVTQTMGEPVLTSREFPFDLSGYYREEMGEILTRVWFAFANLRDPAWLVQWKLSCYRLELDFSLEGGSRSVNLDPGYLDFGKLVLASFKEAPDKIYMGKGVWAHTCLRYGHGSFTAPDHSFPDFADGRFDGFMKGARNLYRKLLRNRPGEK